MAGIPIIIQSGVHGLGVAADYYKQFPWEPSPAGDLDLANAKIVKVDPMTFDDLLVELAKSPPGGKMPDGFWKMLPLGPGKADGAFVNNIVVSRTAMPG